MRTVETHTNAKGDIVIVEKHGTAEELSSFDSFMMKRFMAKTDSPELVEAKRCCADLGKKAETVELNKKETKQLASASVIVMSDSGGCF